MTEHFGTQDNEAANSSPELGRPISRRKFIEGAGIGLGAFGAYGLGGLRPQQLARARSSSTALASSKPIELTFGEHQTARANILKKLLPAFEREMLARGQNIRVTLVENTLPDTAYVTLLTEQYSAGTAPDVNDYIATYVPGYADAGYLLNLTAGLHKWSEWRDFYPQVQAGLTSSTGGKLWALIHEASIQQLWYRHDVLTSLGISTTQPTTWSDLISRLRQITAKTKQPSLIVPVGTQWASPEQGLYNVFIGTSSSLYDKKRGKWIIKSPGINYVFDLLYTLKAGGLIPTEDLLGPTPWEPTKYKAFPAGTMPVSFQGTWGWDFDWGPQGAAPIPNLVERVKTWNLPGISNHKGYVDGSVGWVYAVSAKTRQPKAALALVEWLTQGEPLAQMCVAVGAASPKTGIGAIAPYNNHPQLILAQDEFPLAKSLPIENGQGQIDEAWEKAEDGILSGGMNGSQAAALFAQGATQLLGASHVEG
jgi:multiple sugar transport system substrate-binding protein